jgi:type IX secretion system PorP/SprF family membrane protein
MKKLLTSALLTVLSLGLSAQQEAQFSQNYLINPTFNPGAVGILPNTHCFHLMARQQWMGFEGRPTTALLSYSGNPAQWDNVGIGGTFVYDQIGLQSNIFFKAAGSYSFNVAKGKLGVGADLGVISKQFSGDIIVKDPSDPNVANLNGASSTNFDLGVGVYYTRPRELYFGISGQKLIPQEISWGTATPTLRPHSFITGGYYQQLNDDFFLIPSTIIKTDFVSTQLDVNVLLEYQQFLWGGVSYRVQDAIVFTVGGRKGNMKAGLAYDFTTSNLNQQGTFEFAPDDNGNTPEAKTNNRSFGAVELYLGYCFVQPEPPLFPSYVDPLLPFDLR